VYLYTFTGTAFTGGTLQSIIGSGYTGGKNINQALGANDWFGTGVSLDGTRLAVGAPQDDSNVGGCNDCGAVYLYTFTDTAFSGGSLAARIGAGYTGGKNINQALGASDRFGASVSLDGTSLAVGAPYDDGTASGCAICEYGFLWRQSRGENWFRLHRR